MYYDELKIIECESQEKNFKFFINNIHVGTVTSNEGIMKLDVRYGTYARVSKAAYILLEKLKNSLLLQMRVLTCIGYDVDISQLQFEFGGTSVIAKSDMTLNEIENACYENSNLQKNSARSRKMFGIKK